MRMGLTGGIACGKTLVARLLAEHGAVVVDADQVARVVVEPGSVGLGLLVARFGERILDAEGRLNRKSLGTLVFQDASARQALEAILHPLIERESERRLAEAETSTWLVIYEAALLVEVGRAEAFRPLCVVTAPDDVRVSRLMARDGLTALEAQARLAAQLPLEAKVALADYVIDNGKDRAATEAQVADLFRRILLLEQRSRS